MACCLRIGPRANIICTHIQTLSGISLQWFDKIRYLGVHIIRSSRFKISLDRPKRSFYRVANSRLFSAELDGLLRKKLRYSFSVVNVSRYCYMAWKPMCLTSIRLPLLILSLTDFLRNCLRPIILKLSKRAKNFSAFSYIAFKQLNVQLNSKFNFKRT